MRPRNVLSFTMASERTYCDPLEADVLARLSCGKKITYPQTAGGKLRFRSYLNGHFDISRSADVAPSVELVGANAFRGLCVAD